MTEPKSVKLCAGLTFFPLDDEMVVFLEASQSLIGLNATAAFIVQQLRDGVPVAGLADTLVSEVGVLAGDAQGWVRSTLNDLSSKGLLADGRTPPPAAKEYLALEEYVARTRSRMPPFEPFTPVVEGHYRLLGLHALIRYGHRAQKRMVDSVIGHLQSNDTESPALVIDIQSKPWEGGHQIASNVYCDGQPEAQAMRLSNLGPHVKSALWVHAVNAHDFLLDLHAGVVGKNGQCILLPAAAGSGKSSLTAALTHSGFSYYSDEVALIERGTFEVMPVPLAVCVKSTAWDFMSRYYPELLTLPIHNRQDRKQVRYVMPRPGSVQEKPGQASHIVFPHYAAGEPTQLTRVSRSEALARLMEQCLAFRLSLDAEGVGQLVKWISGIETYTLTFSSLDEAVALVETILPRG